MRHTKETKIDLASKLVAASACRATYDDGLDIHAALEEVLNDIGITSSESGGKINFIGRDPIVPSVLHLASAASIAMVAKSVAMAALHRGRGGPGQDIEMDLRVAPHRLCPFYDKKWEKLNGFVPGFPSDPHNPFLTDFYKTADDRWVMPLNPYPTLKNKIQKLLKAYDDSAVVAKSVSEWRGVELEAAGAQARVVLPMVRSLEEFLIEPQFTDFLANMPLIELEKIADCDPIHLPAAAENPLDGIRALGMGHVIAGAGIGRALALHGADVMNLWRPTETEGDFLYHSAQVGVRSATVDPRSPEGHEKIKQLLRGADIFYANRQPGYLESIGFSAEQCAQIKPGIIHVTITLHGRAGPWANRLGFDQTAGCVSGTTILEGSESAPKLPCISVVNDYIVSWLCAAGAAAALIRRAEEGGSYRVHVSLTRVALWLTSLGLFEKEYAYAIAGSGGKHAYLDPATFQADTALGLYQGVTDQVKMSVTPGSYRIVMIPRGSCRPEWL